ncbi:MFS transporter [Photobacterium sp. 1_MG-2023]|uniref:MFS transporter n=1 Tax=Photobacterium sp. 1_MG-2023 TaxID=3062646 RepID=UPI0026E1B22B|nr:MFS transporter [Photobacterium sp. 1_MG-2023]MDO6708554.1 MFS transporter [Photobacterium sp. 1_MG-2023]
MKHSAEQRSISDWAGLLLIVLIGLNLRPFLVAPGPILNTIMQDLSMSAYSASLLTLLPMFLMGVGAFIAPVILSRYGTRPVVLSALTAILTGCVFRFTVTTEVAFLLTAVLCGAGVTLIQSAMPGQIKATFPKHIAPATGLYSACLMVGGALGAYGMPHLMQIGLNWRQSLAVLAVPALVAMLFSMRFLVAAASKKQDGNLVKALLCRPRTWTLMLAFGLVNSGYSTLVAWLAPFYQSLGWRQSDSASLVVVLSVCQAISAVGLPVLARRSQDRRTWLFLTVVFQAVGFYGLAAWPEMLPMFWVGICGAGLGGSFALVIVTALDHLESAESSGTLAALMQGGGFMIAAVAPLLIAGLKDLTASYEAGWLMHLGFVVITGALYLRLNPRFYPVAMDVAGCAADRQRIPHG